MNSPIKPQKKVGLILRIKYGIGVFFILLGLISSVGTLILFIYAFKGNLFAIIFLITTYTYLYGFCKRNQKIIDFAYWFEGQKWFNHFEVINEEAIPDNSCIFAVIYCLNIMSFNFFFSFFLLLFSFFCNYFLSFILSFFIF